MRKFDTLLLAFFAGCGNEGRTATKAAPPPQPPPVPECSPVDGSPRECKNMLPDGWRAYATDAKVSQLGGIILAMKQLNPKPDLQVVHQHRRASVECRKDDQANENHTVDVAYFRPDAMDGFPQHGTEKRDLVTAIIESDVDKNCMESLYGAVKAHGGWTRLVAFVVAKTWSAPVPSTTSTDDLSIGEWQSWAIEKKGNHFRHHELRRGAFVRCGFPHGSAYGSVAFITCDDAARLHRKAAEEQVSVKEPYAIAKAFSRLIARYNTGTDDKIKALTTGDPFDAPAWGRCGNLGCCAAY